MGKFDLFDNKFSNNELDDSPFFDWTIYAFQGHMSQSALKDTVIVSFTKQGMTLEIEEPMRMVFEHPQFDASIEISFENNDTVDGTHYALSVHSESFGRKNEDAINQKRLYDIVFSLIPQRWRKESYFTEDGKDNLIYKTLRRLRLKRRRKV